MFHVAVHLDRLGGSLQPLKACWFGMATGYTVWQALEQVQLWACDVFISEST